MPSRAIGRLPNDGPARIGGVKLPPGRRLTPSYADGGPALWATVDLVPNPVATWSRLRRAHPDTGLVPLVLDSLRDSHPSRPWDNGEFEPGDVGRCVGTYDVKRI